MAGSMSMCPEPVTFRLENPKPFYAEIAAFCADINESMRDKGSDEVLRVRAEDQLTPGDLALTGRDPKGRLISLQVLYSVPSEVVQRPGRELGSGAMRHEYLGKGLTRFHAKALAYYGMRCASSAIYCVTRASNAATIASCARHDGMVIISTSEEYVVYVLDRDKFDLFRDMYIAGRDEAIQSPYCDGIADELLALENHSGL